MPPAALHPQLAPEPVLLNARANGDAFPVHDIRPKTIIQQPSKTNSRLHASWPSLFLSTAGLFCSQSHPQRPHKKTPERHRPDAARRENRQQGFNKHGSL